MYENTVISKVADFMNEKNLQYILMYEKNLQYPVYYILCMKTLLISKVADFMYEINL